MSGIIILDRRVDLSGWLKEHGLTILVWKTSVGHIAKFREYVSVEGAAPCPTANDEISSVKMFVWSLRGARIGVAGPPTVVVPEFSGIEEAVKDATRTSTET
jgi:hypothetical protein